MNHADPAVAEPSRPAGDAHGDALLALQELTGTLAHAVSEVTIFTEALEVLRSTLNLAGAVVQLSDASGRMQFQAHLGTSDDLQKAMECHSPWVAHGSAVLVEDLEAEPSFTPLWPVLYAEGIRSLAFIPLMESGRLRGQFLLWGRVQRRFLPGDLGFAGAVANLAELALARVQWVRASQQATTVQAAGGRIGSEETFSKIFHLSPDAIDLTRLADGVSLDCNHSYMKLYGYSREEIIGHSTLPGDLGVWVNKEDRDRHIAELKAHGEVFGFEAPLRRKDGVTFIGLISSTVLEIDGEWYNLSLTKDITERKQAEDALRASEERFSRIFYLCPDSITINRLEDGVYLDVNPGFTDMFGFPREEAIHRSSMPDDLGIWVDQADRDRLVSGLKNRGEVIGLEARFRHKSGRILTGLESCRVVEIHGVPCLISLTKDITERKLAEEALHVSNQRLQLALASDNLGIWDRNLLDRNVIWNDRMYEIYGVDKATFNADFDCWAREIVHPDDALETQETIQAALAGERPYDLGFRIVRPDGTVRYIKSNGMVIRDADGQAVRVIGINRDRTEQVEAEAERRRLQAEVNHAEKLESIGSLAGGVAHDMNNVLAAILITTEVLRGKCTDGDPTVKPLDVILHAVKRGRDLVKALTDFSRKGLEETSTFDLNEVLQQEVELLRHTTLQKIQVILDLDENLPTLLGAASDLGSAIMNLSVNAVDAMPEGGTLTFRSRDLRDGRIELSVTDTGQGMLPEVLARAMEPFFTTKPVGKGTGLGLSRVYGTVRAHGGTVEIQSAAGKGTTAILRLPTSPGLAKAGGSLDGVLEEDPGPSLRILLVDDDGIILETIPSMLESIGHTVETASRGEEALHRLNTHQAFDLVILDQNMPGLTGVQTLVQLRRTCPGLPVILSTGFMDVKTEDLLASIPHVWILKKPYDMREMQRTLAGISRVPTLLNR